MAKKVIVWRVLSIVLCTLAGRIWFGDWHVTMFGIFLSVMMTFVHYFFERVWDRFEYPNRKRTGVGLFNKREWYEL